SHGAARATKSALEEAREQVAAVCGARPHEIVFTGGGSEGDNLAVKGAAWSARARDARLVGVVTTGIEHKADLGALAAALDPTTAVVSVMLVNNETGVRQPLADVVGLVRELAPNAVVHTD